MRGDTDAMMERFDVRPRAPELACGRFSGGNQQKLVLARELGQTPRVLLAGQPTRGVDIGAIEFIHGQLRAMRAAGCAILVVSSEIDEILALADRVLVMNAGRITGECTLEEATPTRLGLLMAQEKAAPREMEAA
jgi:simple sugar transport system ATP-binding protein